MNPRLNPAQIVLGAVCVVLAVVLGYLLFAPIPEVPVPQVQARTEPVDDTPLPRFDAPPKQAFAEVDDRLVFNPDRVRVEGPSLPGSTSTALPSDLSLVGVIMDGDTRLALFKSSAAPLAVGVGIGGSIEGWQVTRVDSDRVALRSGGAEQEIKFSTALPPAPPPSQMPPNVRPGMGPNFRPLPLPRSPIVDNNNNNNENRNNSNNNNNNNNDDNSDDDSNN